MSSARFSFCVFACSFASPFVCSVVLSLVFPFVSSFVLSFVRSIVWLACVFACLVFGLSCVGLSYPSVSRQLDNRPLYQRCHMK